MKKMLESIATAVFVFAGFFISIVLHEFGHCLFYWFQGIPARQSLVKEYPMHDISVLQYSIGSWGGILVNWIFLIVLFFLAFHLSQKGMKKTAFVLKRLFYGESILLLIYGIFLMKGADKTEFIYAQNIVHLPKYSIVVITLLLTVSLLYFFITGSRVRIRMLHVAGCMLLIFGIIIVYDMIERYDRTHNWHKYPAVKIGNEMLYNEPVH